MKKLFIAFAAMAIITSTSYAQPGLGGENIYDYEFAVPAKFALTITESSSLYYGPTAPPYEPQGAPESYTLTSKSIINQYDLPGDARCYWVLGYEGIGYAISGGLVIASNQTGEIYEEFAYGFGTTLFGLVEGGGEPGFDAPVVIKQKKSTTNMLLNMALVWGMDFEAPPIITFGRFTLNIKEGSTSSKVSFASVSSLAGDYLDYYGDRAAAAPGPEIQAAPAPSGFIVTNGFIKAKGKVEQRREPSVKYPN